MMIISLEKQSRGERYNLFSDGEFYSGIEPDSVVKYHLKNGVEIEKEKIDEILFDSETFYGFNKVLKYITKSMKTTGEIEQYLLKYNFKQNIIQNILDKLNEYKYVNDELYCKNYIDYYKEKYGKNKLKQNLLLKKIDEDIINLYLNFDDEVSLDNIKKEILKQTKNKELDIKLKQKIIRNLISKGYSYELIKTAFNEEDE